VSTKCVIFVLPGKIEEGAYNYNERFSMKECKPTEMIPLLGHDIVFTYI